MEHIDNNALSEVLDLLENKKSIPDRYKQHLTDCKECRLTLKDNLTTFNEWNLLESSTVDVTEIIIDFAARAGERVMSTIWNFIDSLTLPEAAVAVRSAENVVMYDKGVSLKRRFEDFTVSINVCRKSTLLADIELLVTDNLGTGHPTLRAGLFSGNTEIDSASIKSGTAKFSDVGMGEYILSLWDKNQDKLNITIAMKG